MTAINHVYISGASGFIGSNIIGRLKEDSINFSSLSRNDLKRFILYPEQFDGRNSVFIHCAGLAHVFGKKAKLFKAEFDKTNIELTVGLAKSALKTNMSKFIFLSTVAVFGSFHRGVIADNQYPFPNTFYGLSKHLAEVELGKIFKRQHHPQCIIFRLPMVYGPGNKGNMRALLKAASRGIPLPLASTKGKRSFIYIKNICDAIVKVLQDPNPKRPPMQIYPISDGLDLTSGELYQLIFNSFSKRRKAVFYIPEGLLRYSGRVFNSIEALIGKTLPYNREVVSRLIDEYRVSNDHFCRDYNWKPPYHPHEGVAETVSWYKSQNNNNDS